MTAEFLRAAAIVALAIFAIAVTGCSPDDPLAAIRELQEKQRYQESIEPLRAMLDEDPDQPEANFLLGTALMRTGKSSNAIWPLRRAMESDEYAVEAGLMLGRAELASRTPRDVLNAVERVLEVEPDNAEALVIRAQGYLKAKRVEESLADIDRVTELDPENLGILVPRVLALIHLERIEEAEQALVIAKDMLDTTDQEIGKPFRSRLCVANALFAFEKGDPESATLLYEECLEAHPTDHLVITESVKHFDRLEEPERATELLRQAIEASSEPSVFKNALARRMGRLGDPEGHERLLREEAEEQDTPSAWFALADFYVVRDRFDEGVAAFEKGIAADSQPTSVMRFAYVDTLIQAKRFEDARREMVKVEQPYLRDLLNGRLLLETGDPSGALDAFESGIRLWPNNAGARFLAGQAAEQIGDFDRAIEEYREALRRRGRQGETDAALYLARILADKGAHRAALTNVHMHLQSYPDDTEALLLAIRVADELAMPQLVNQKMTRLANSGQGAVAIAAQIAILTEHSGSQAAIDAAETSGLDLTDPANAIALRALLEQHAALAQHAEARARIATALELHPEEAAFHELAGRVVLAADGASDEARGSFERALALAPERSSALAGLADLLAASAARDEAMALYDRAAAADPEDSAPAYAAIALLQAATRSDEAERRLAALVERNPRDARAADALAQSLAERGGDLDRALSYAKRAAYFTTVPEATETLGWILLLRAEYDAAVEVLTEAAEARPDATSVRYRLGLALAAQGDDARAREEFDAVIRAGGAETEQARSELARLDPLRSE